jgi:hypothetical protein
MDETELEQALAAQAASMAKPAEPTTEPVAAATTPTTTEPVVVEDYTEKYKQSEAEKEALAAKLAQLEASSKEPVFASDFHKKAYDYAIAHPEMDINDAFREYAEITTLNPDKLDEYELLQKAFELSNKDSGLSKEELKTLFKRDYRQRFEYDAEEDDDDDVKFKQIQRKAELVKAKTLVSQEKAKYTPKKAEPQFTEKDKEDARNQRESVAKSYATTLAEKPITFTVDNSTFNFKPDKDAIDDSVLAVKDIPTYLNERYGVKSADGKPAWDFQALQRDFAMINSIDKLVEEAHRNGVNIGKESVLKQANGITPVTPTAAIEGKVSAKDAQQAFTKEIANFLTK